MTNQFYFNIVPTSKQHCIRKDFHNLYTNQSISLYFVIKKVICSVHIMIIAYEFVIYFMGNSKYEIILIRKL